MCAHGHAKCEMMRIHGPCSPLRPIAFRSWLKQDPFRHEEDDGWHGIMPPEPFEANGWPIAFRPTFLPAELGFLPGSTDDAFSAPPTGSLIQDVARRFARDLPPAPAGDFIREAEGFAAAITRPAVALDTLDLVGITHGIHPRERGRGEGAAEPNALEMA